MLWQDQVPAVGHDYRQYFAAAYFGRPLMAADERYINGRATLDTPVGVVENDPLVDSAANQALWGIYMMVPSAYLSDPRVRWEAIDEHTARTGFWGAAMFVFSDSVLALGRFGVLANPFLRYVVIITYWLGQLDITRSAISQKGE